MNVYKVWSKGQALLANYVWPNIVKIKKIGDYVVGSFISLTSYIKLFLLSYPSVVLSCEIRIKIK